MFERGKRQVFLLKRIGVRENISVVKGAPHVFTKTVLSRKEGNLRFYKDGFVIEKGKATSHAFAKRTSLWRKEGDLRFYKDSFVIEKGKATSHVFAKRTSSWRKEGNLRFTKIVPPLARL